MIRKVAAITFSVVAVLSWRFWEVFHLPNVAPFVIMTSLAAISVSWLNRQFGDESGIWIFVMVQLLGILAFIALPDLQAIQAVILKPLLTSP